MLLCILGCMLSAISVSHDENPFFGQSDRITIRFIDPSRPRRFSSSVERVEKYFDFYVEKKCVVSCMGEMHFLPELIRKSKSSHRKCGREVIAIISLYTGLSERKWYVDGSGKCLTDGNYNIYISRHLTWDLREKPLRYW